MCELMCTEKAALLIIVTEKLRVDVHREGCVVDHCCRKCSESHECLHESKCDDVMLVRS